MNALKRIFLGASIFAAAAGATLVSGCEEDACLDLKCLNGGSCADGFCRCPTGYEGAECEIRSADRFIGVFAGIQKCDDLPNLADTVEVFLKASPITVGVVRYSDTTDTLTGTVKGYEITFPEFTTDRYGVIRLTDQNLTFYEENVNGTDVDSGNYICTFVGNKVDVD